MTNRLSPGRWHCGYNTVMPGVIKVLTFNIGFCGGWHGLSDGVQSRHDVLRRLQMIHDVIVEADADVVMLQEVDVHSRRSAYVDQVYRLAQIGGYAHYDFATVWKHPWVPFPSTLNLQRHFGPIHAGNLILSRRPIVIRKQVPLTQRLDKGALYRFFYLKQVYQECVISFPGQAVRFGHLHLDAFHTDTRHIQLVQALGQIPKISESPVILAGDFNSIGYVPGTRCFPDEPGNDYGEDVTLSELDTAGFRRILPLNGASDESLFDFPASGPNRPLSHIWSRGIVGSGGCLSASDASDHIPLLATFEI